MLFAGLSMWTAKQPKVIDRLNKTGNTFLEIFLFINIFSYDAPVSEYEDNRKELDCISIFKKKQ
jgi:hypothetical protein